MKEISLIIAIALGTFLFSGNASAYFNVSPVASDEKTVVEITMPDNLRSSLTIYNPQGNLIHDESFDPGQDNTRIYDLTNLEDGVYSFNSEMDFYTTFKKIKVENSTVEVISKDVEFRPVFNMKDDYLLISFLNMDQEYVDLVIESNFRIYHEGDSENSVTYHKAVNVSNLFRGEYYATITAGGKTYRHAFMVD